ncbi:MAG: hypothetical protein ABH871_00855 [Pseudomonadota bacterium]
MEAQLLKQEKLARLHDFFTKTGQVIHPLHILMPHGSTGAPLWPLISWTRGGFPPKFPHVPNRHLYANLHQLINGGNAEKLNGDQMQALLEYVGVYAQDPNHHRILRPIAQTLAMARASEQHGERINEFFQNNPWIPELLNVDFNSHTPPSDRYRRNVRRALRKATKVPFERYQEWTKSHTAQQGGADHLDDMFTVRSLDSKATVFKASALSTQGDDLLPAGAKQIKTPAKPTRKR